MITQALKIQYPYIDLILDGLKTWEMRSTACHKRGVFGLSPKGSGVILGTVEIIDCIRLAELDDMIQYFDKHLVNKETWLQPNFQKYRYAWVLSNAKRLKKPIHFQQKSGPVRWITLDVEVANKLWKANEGF